MNRLRWSRRTFGSLLIRKLFSASVYTAGLDDTFFWLSEQPSENSALSSTYWLVQSWGLFWCWPGGPELITTLSTRSILFIWQHLPGPENFFRLVHSTLKALLGMHYTNPRLITTLTLALLHHLFNIMSVVQSTGPWTSDLKVASSIPGHPTLMQQW